MGSPRPKSTPIGALVSLLWTAVLPALANRVEALPAEVRSLSAEPDFRQVSLHWLYPRLAADLFAFRVDFCELQAWGVNRCRTKIVDAPPRRPVSSGEDGEDLSEYGAVVTGLRMATNYTFTVAPIEGRLQQHVSPYHARNRHARTIMAPTKGFSARATLCLPDVSEVEVLTGPHFSGRIAVEANEQDVRDVGMAMEAAGGADGPCAVAGDASSPRESYTLRIDHRRCGSHVNRSTVATFILVQENLPILTHSTRRFLVLCTFQPDALIVRAGISLPTVHGDHRHREDLGGPAHGNQLGGIGMAGPAEVMAFQLQAEAGQDDAQALAVQSRQQRRHAGRALGLGEEPGHDLGPDGDLNGDEAREAQVVLTSVLLVSGVVFCAVAAWWLAPRRRALRAEGGDDALTDDSASTVSAYQNYENSLRDSDSIGTVNSSILSTLSRHHWAYLSDMDKEVDAKVDACKAWPVDDEFGEEEEKRTSSYTEVSKYIDHLDVNLVLRYDQDVEEVKQDNGEYVENPQAGRVERVCVWM